MTVTEYLAIAGPARTEAEVKRSRFVCDLARVETESEARDVIERIRGTSREARHHCTAFILGPTGAIQRSNDDGEPSGTAGMPMLDVLRGRGLTDVAAVVTRWFGGVLLGTGGLARAYGDAVTAALGASTLQRRALLTTASVAVGHRDGPRVENALRSSDAVTLVDVSYDADGVTLQLAITPDGREQVAGTIAALTGGAAQLILGEPHWLDVP